jgi:hypothetical protein
MKHLIVGVAAAAGIGMLAAACSSTSSTTAAGPAGTYPAMHAASPAASGQASMAATVSLQAISGDTGQGPGRQPRAHPLPVRGRQARHVGMNRRLRQGEAALHRHRRAACGQRRQPGAAGHHQASRRNPAGHLQRPPAVLLHRRQSRRRRDGTRPEGVRRGLVCGQRQRKQDRHQLTAGGPGLQLATTCGAGARTAVDAPAPFKPRTDSRTWPALRWQARAVPLIWTVVERGSAAMATVQNGLMGASSRSSWLACYPPGLSGPVNAPVSLVQEVPPVIPP